MQYFYQLRLFFDQRDYYLAIVPITYSVVQVRSFIIDGIGQNKKCFILLNLFILIKRYFKLRYQKQVQNTFPNSYFNRNDFHMESNYKREKYYFIKQQFDYKYNRIIMIMLLFLGHQHQFLESIIGKLRLKSMSRRKKSLQEQKVIDLYIQPTTTRNFYGYICLYVRTFEADGLIRYYGYQAIQNDTIQMVQEELYDFIEMVLDVEKHLTI
ncbi:unnamed protein product [Paramecium primaurelia]|uniref:Uncharacterized protein n=1 Tax=Paramecium primaurelia TaxID=5886 RepID=A0A8S1LTT3_PARPR|nr:unnamed protein product [Paramecium primaurelia]